jgi:hypothetical protein
MAVDAYPFGVATSQNLYGLALPVVLSVWDPTTPKPIAPGQLDAVTTVTRRIYYQFSRDYPGWRALAQWIGEGWQAVSDQQAEIASLRGLANGYGQILDEIGYGVGLDRMGLGDDDYRRAIRVRGASLDSDGSIPEILDIVAGLFGEAAAVGAYVPWYPAAAALYVPSLSASDADLLVFLVREAIPSGVGLTLVLTDLAAPGPSYSDGATPALWAGPRPSFSGGVGLDESATGPAYGVAIA